MNTRHWKRTPAVIPALLLGTLSCQSLHAGIFAPAAGQPGSTAIAHDDDRISGWAEGYINYRVVGDVDDEFETPGKALGPAGDSDGDGEIAVDGFIFDIVSLGRGGEITLIFDPPIRNGAGADFAVFENGFSDSFLELGRVSVSSDGANFFAFDAFSLTPAAVTAFGTLDTTDVEQVAGKYRAGFGAPFDLDQLAGSQGLDLESVRYVKIVDIVGNGAAPNNNDLNSASLAAWLGVAPSELPDSLRDIADNAPPWIYDPFPTGGSTGLDLDAIAVINQAPFVDEDVPIPAAWLVALAAAICVGQARFRTARLQG